VLDEGSQSHGIRSRVRGGTEAAKRRYEGSPAEHVWRRLNSMDFINRGMLFAAVLLLCFFPFMIVLNALGGHSAVTGLTRHLGLNQEAAGIVSKLFTSPSATTSAITGTAWLFFVLGGLAAAAAISGLYEAAFDVEPRGMKNMPRAVIWLAVLSGGVYLGGLLGPRVHSSAGPVVLALLGLVVFTAFWWFTMSLLLAGRIPWRDLFPGALATAICWVGMEVVFSFIFSSTVIEDNKKYGAIGVVFALMSWLIAIGVVIIIGAVVGVVWLERRRDRKAPEAVRPVSD